MTYIEEQKKCGIKEGDRVRIIRKAKGYENGWEDIWLNSMDETVGMIGVVAGISPAVGIYVTFESIDRSYFYPYFVLEVVE